MSPQSRIREIVDAVPAWFAETSVGKKMAAERAEKARADRQASVDRLSVCHKDRRTALAKHAAVVATRRAERDQLQAAALTADSAYRQALASQGQHVGPIDRQIEGLERMLRSTGPPEIDAARRSLWDRLHRERESLGRSATVDSGRRDGDTFKPIMIVQTNEAAIGRLLAAMRVADAALEALKLANPGDVATTIAAALAPVEAAWEDVQHGKLE